MSTMLAQYSNTLMEDLWKHLAPGFYNYGRIAPDADLDSIPDLQQANEEMVQYIISKLGITKESKLLDLACGKGMYTVRIAEITGCSYTGVDLTEHYLEECKQWAASHGVTDQGEFLQGSMLDIPARVKEQKYSHIISLGAVFYVHNKLDQLLENFSSCADDQTKILIWDFHRNVDWSLCEVANRHLKMAFPMASKEEFLEKVERSKLELADLEDMTPYIIPGYKIMERECRNRDPELKYLTYPFFGQAIIEGKVSYAFYYLKLSQ